jgi:hypothetical protein
MGAVGSPARVLLTGWFSFRRGEVTAGDVLALESVRSALDAAGLRYDTVWSEVFRPGALRLDDAFPERYSHLVFVCGPVHGEQVAGLHRRFAGCRRIAVGVTVIDPADPAVTGFDVVLARDPGPSTPVRDLATAAVASARPVVPVTGVILTCGQGEYGDRRRHEAVTSQITGWLNLKTCAPVPLETRLDIRDWRLCATTEAFMSVLARLDIVVTTRLHGLALALSAGVPAFAVDPVAGGGKVTAQARAWRWPGLVPAEQAADQQRLDVLWDWCLSAAGRQAAQDASARPVHDLRFQLDALVDAMGPR